MALRNAFANLSTEAKQDTQITGIGAIADAEATGNGSIIGLLKRLRTLLAGGLPAALGGAGGVKVEQQGSVSVTGPVTDAQLRASAVPVSGTVTASGPLTDTQLRATAVPVSGSVTASGPITDTQLRASAPAVRDDYSGGEVLADQTGAAAVLTFNFASAVQLVVVHGDGADGELARADPFGGTPSAVLGIPCGSEIPTYLPVTTSSVKVFAPASMVVSVWGYRRS